MIVALTNRAKKQLARLNEPDLSRIAKGINGLECDPPKGDIKKLRGQPGVNRLRVGDYRILFTIGVDIIDVFKIAPRGGIYKEEAK